MSLPNQKPVSIQEFYYMQENTDQILEYINGIVLMTPSPSTKHQRISTRLTAKLHNFLEGKECEVFHAPFDIHLKNDEIEGEAIVVPDLSIICDKKGFDDKRFVGVPEMIIEILSPSNQSHDLVVKLNLYMQYGVKEYWTINPMLNVVQIYRLNEDGQYFQAEVQKEKGIVTSDVLSGFTIEVMELFQ